MIACIYEVWASINHQHIQRESSFRAFVVYTDVYESRSVRYPDRRDGGMSIPMLMISPSFNLILSGIPWQMTSFTDLKHARNHWKLVVCKVYSRADGLGEITIIER